MSREMNRSIRHRTILRTALTLVLLLCAAGSLSAQMFPERKHIRSGNKAYEALDYAAAEQEYRQAQIDTPTSPEAAFNLADALYKQERYEEAENTLKALSEKPELLTAEQAAKVYHNLGNAQFQQQKLSEALESFKQAQRINPDDLETKYNLAYTKKLLEENENSDNQQQQDNNEQGGDNQNDQNQDQNNDQNQDNNQDNNQNNEGENPDNQNDQSDDQNDQNNNGQDDRMEDTPPPPSRDYGDSRVNQAEAEQMLNAVQQQEDKTREKVNAQQAVTVAPSGKNW